LRTHRRHGANGDIDADNNSDDGDITVNCGAIRINKNTTKEAGTAVANAGAVFSITGQGISGSMSVTDDTSAAAPDEDAAVGRVCVSGLQPGGSYTVNETSPPSGYAGATESDVTSRRGCGRLLQRQPQYGDVYECTDR